MRTLHRNIVIYAFVVVIALIALWFFLSTNHVVLRVGSSPPLGALGALHSGIPLSNSNSPAQSSMGQVLVGSPENTYTNKAFGLTFRYPSTFRLYEGYPKAIPPITEASTTSPYSILLFSSSLDRYPFIKIDVLPKSAWDETVADIKRQDYPYYPFPQDQGGEPLALNGTTAYRYTGDGNPYIYYFQQPYLPYMLTFRPWDLPNDVPSVQLFYGILGSFKFTN
jgi:hypothetical protein